MGKAILVVVFFLGAPFLLIVSILFLSFLTYQLHSASSQTVSSSLKKSVSYAALPTTQNSFLSEVEQKDARFEAVRGFLAQYRSPLEPYAQEIVEAADQYGLDYRLVPAIAMQESNLCKKAPIDTNNCWGFGIYGKKVIAFKNYSEAILTVTRTLAHDYKGKGLATPEAIMTRYTPSNNGDWAFSVNHFMAQIQ